MGLAPHQVLSRLAEQKRDEIQTSLSELERQRLFLLSQCDDLKAYQQQLIKERDQVLHGSPKASMLMMLGDAMQEQHLCLVQVGQRLQDLEAQEVTLRQAWIAANQTCEVHDKMQYKLEKELSRKQEHRVQQQMDDVFAARFAREVKHS